MTETTAKPPRRNTLLDHLQERYPVFKDCRPLALGIHKTIREREPEINAGELRLAMRLHTTSTRYLKALLAGKERFNLDGLADGEVTEEHRSTADTSLRERFQKAAERRKAEAQAQRTAKMEQEASQRRAEKLAQLAERFNSR